MTVYTALWGDRRWQDTTPHPEPPYQQTIFTGAEGVPIFGWVAIPKNAHGTIVATYGITGELEQQWFLQLLGRKAYAQGYAVVLFDWRGHGKTGQLSPALTTDGLYEGEDFVSIAAEAANMGCPRQFWFIGYSLGGQLALWGLKKAADLERNDVVGGAVICPSLDSYRSLKYVVTKPFGKYVEARIAKELKQMAWKIYHAHPGSLDIEAINRVNSIWGYDQELVIQRLGFATVEDYYRAGNGLQLLPQLSKPTLIIYAADDPLFDPAIIPDLAAACANNPVIDLLLTRHGGHVGYFNSKIGQVQNQDPDPWWAWNRILQWIGANSNHPVTAVSGSR